jgi:crotonobetainyl-CoA:carnitine CoA-transferase CaiB-like acyl-CoA transferase
MGVGKGVMEMTLRPLIHVRIAEVANLLPGPFAGLMLRQLGAEVVKLEVPHGRPGSDPLLRPQAPADRATEMRLGVAAKVFSALNEGKCSRTLDLTSPEAIERTFFSVLRDVDVVLVCAKPRAFERFGITAQSLHRKFPRLIVCWMSGYGLPPTPWQQRGGHDLNYLANGGVLGMMPQMRHALSNEGAGASTNFWPLPAQVADIAGGSYPAVIQILSAVLDRKSRWASEEDYRGCIIDVNMCANSYRLLFLSECVSAAMGSAVPVDKGAFPLCGAAPCYNLYPTRDGRWVAVGAIERTFWVPLVRRLSLPPVFESERFQYGMDPGAEREAKDALRHAFMQRDASHWEATLGDCAVDVVRSPREACVTFMEQSGASRVTPGGRIPTTIVGPPPVVVEERLVWPKGATRIGQHDGQPLASKL